MKQFYLKSLFLCLLFMMGAKTSARIAVKNDDGITIYYDEDYQRKTLSVTFTDYNSWSRQIYSSYSGIIVIPEFVTYNGDTYTVTEIREKAFIESKVTSVTIPKSVTRIGDDAFQNCESLTSVTVLGSLDYIGRYAFWGCESLTSVIIPKSVIDIRECAFGCCPKLTLVIIGKEVKSIGKEAFFKSYPLIICESVNPPSAQYDSFESGTKGIVPQESKQLYYNTTGWNKLKLNFPLEVTKTQTTITLKTSDLFSNQFIMMDDPEKGTKYYPQDGLFTITGLSPNKSYDIYWEGEYESKAISGTSYVTTSGVKVYLKSIKATNTTLLVKGSVDAGDASVTDTGFEGKGKGDECTLTGLAPGSKHSFTFYAVCSDGSRFSQTEDFYTVPVGVSISANPTASSCLLTGNYSVIDATVTSFGFKDNPEQTELKLTGLDPVTEYSREFYVTTKEGGKASKSQSFTTQALTMTTQQPKVISVGNVIVAAESNLDDEETNAGFEWRRTDWTDDFASNTGGAYIYEGTMEGYIRNLNTEKLWKVRPYYESNSGKRYYGEWMGLDPTNTSYFEPTVHTYAKIDVQNNTASVKGYAMRGSDNVASQGFKYWKSAAGARAQGGSKVSVPADAKTVEASGQVMTAELTGLDYESSYSYAAFMTTTEGQTFYGEVQSFQTGVDTSGIDSPTTAEEAYEVARYDVKGRRISTPQRGLNILRLSDGSVRKVMVK